MKVSGLLFRSILLCLLCSGVVCSLDAQSTPGSTGNDPDRVDARAFSVLFRRAITFEKMARDAEDAGRPKPHLRRLLATELQLAAFDANSLLRIALDWQGQTLPLQSEASRTVAGLTALARMGKFIAQAIRA